MRELDDVDLLVLCAEAVTEPQGVNLIAWTLRLCALGGGNVEFARLMNHPSMQWYITRHASYISRAMCEQLNWYGELR